MQKLINLFSHIIVVARHYPKAIAEAEAAKLYIHAVKDARLAVIGLIAFFTAVFFLVIGFIMFSLGLVYKLAPDALPTVIVVFGGVLFILPALAFVFGLSQRFLVKATKIEDLVDRVKDDTFSARNTSPAH
jgi:hypothetical protein